jgi:perosamine synthetase
MIDKEEREAVLRVMDRGILSGYQGNWSDAFYGGEEIKALESEWAEYFGAKHAIAVNSATSGLWAACAAIGLQTNTAGIEAKTFPAFPQGAKLKIVSSEVIVSPYSMTCSASIPLHFGAKPVFADIEEDYYCLDPKSVEKRITGLTKAIIAVDLFGQPYDADAINEIADRKGKEYGHKIYVIEDAAQAAGAKYKSKYAGTLGDIGIYSLNVHKPIQCGEGGVIVTNDDNLAFKLRLIINHAEAVMNDFYFKSGEETKDDVINSGYGDLIGMNLRMTELSAAIAREQLKKLEEIIKKQQEYAKCFEIKVRPNCEHAFYRYAWNAKNSCKLVGDNPNGYAMGARYQNKKDEIQWFFNVKRHYIKPIYQMPLFQSLGYDQHCCPVCEEIDENITLAWLREVV